MGSGTAVATGDIITAAKMNLKLETIVDADLSKTCDWTIGVDGAGQDIIFYTDTSGRVITWDTSDSQLEFDDDVLLAFGDDDDVTMEWDASKLEILPATNDTGSIAIGNGTKSIDFLWYGSTAAKNITFDVGTDRLELDDIDLYLGDNDILVFGDGADVLVRWTSALLTILPATDDTGAVNFGDGTTDMDVKIFLGTTSEYALFDVGNSMVSLAGNLSTVLGITSTLTGATADNAMEITVTDSQTNASGYARGLYINCTAGGTKTGSGEHNSLGVDLTVSGNTPYAYITSLYMVTSGNPTIGLASAISIYVDDLGTATASHHMLDLQYGSTNAPTTRNAYMRIRNHSDNTPTAVMYLQANNNAKAATYLLEQDTSTIGPGEEATFTNDTIGTTVEDGFINILIKGTPAKMPFWYDN